MDADAKRDLLSEDIPDSTRRDIFRAWARHDDVTYTDVSDVASDYRRLDGDGQRQLQRLVDETGDGGVQLASELETGTLRRLLNADCGSASVGAVSSGGQRLHSAPVVTAAALSGDCVGVRFGIAVVDVTERVDDFDAGRFLRSVGNLDNPQAFKRQVADGDIPLRELASKSKDIRDIEQTSIGGTRLTTFEITRETGGGTVTGEVIYPADTDEVFASAARQSYGDAEPEAYVDADTPADSWDDLTDSKGRGAFVEEKLTPHYLEEKAGLEVLCVDTGCGTGANGIDVIAWDPQQERLVVVESKWTTDTKAASMTKLGDNRKGTPENDIQMTKGWIEDAWTDARRTKNIDLDQSISTKDEIISSTGEESLEDAVNEIITEKESYDRAYFYTSNSRNGKSISKQDSRSYYPSDIFDRIYHFKAGGIDKDG